jgi:hypothetical protein
MFLTVVFFILAVLFSIEALTSLSRLAGYNVNRSEGGFILQSSMAMVSRVLVFFMLPIIGFMGDSGYFYTLNQLALTYHNP